MPIKFKTPCELPTAHEREILTILIEECAEVQQRATKLLRFGRDEVQPGQSFSNMERLSLEIGDLQCLIEMAEEFGLVNPNTVFDMFVAKRWKLEEYMQTSPNQEGE